MIWSTWAERNAILIPGLNNDGYKGDVALSQALQDSDYSAKHAWIITEAMKKRGVPVVTEMGDLLKYAWSVAIAGPAAGYIAGDKKGVTK